MVDMGDDGKVADVGARDHFVSFLEGGTAPVAPMPLGAAVGEARALTRVPVEPPLPDAISGGGPTAGPAAKLRTCGGLAAGRRAVHVAARLTDRVEVSNVL